MGIRFYCPNGHKLNVKDFLAGKRGICPRCSARFRIPQESQVSKDAPKTRPTDPAAIPEPQAVGASTAATEVEQLPLGRLDMPPEPVLHAPAPESDPIAEAPQAVWYVRPPSGGQFGPARGDVMQRWIIEGRVSADTLVWREGWPDWRAAGPLFPTLSSESPTSNPALDEPTEIKVDTDDDVSLGRRATLPHRNAVGSRQKSVAMVVTLTLVILALLVVLVFVLHGVG
ncbi:MAG: DUF4339 domain-containing protein [Pirellulaceae bacterium]